ncbi:MAG: hypothetical protein ABI378_00645, partial [Chitinophagaceae bacterium]
MDKGFGFLKDSQGGKVYFFYFDRWEQLELEEQGFPVHQFARKGDVFKYSVRASLKRTEEMEAYNLIYVGNPKFEKRKEVQQSGKAIYGQIRKIGELYFVEDIKTRILLKLKFQEREK